MAKEGQSHTGLVNSVRTLGLSLNLSCFEGGEKITSLASRSSFESDKKPESRLIEANSSELNQLRFNTINRENTWDSYIELDMHRTGPGRSK